MSSASEFPERRDWLKNRADLADDDSKNFWNVPKNSASNDEREEVEKDQTGHLKNSAIGQRFNSAPKMDVFSRSFQIEA